MGRTHGRVTANDVRAAGLRRWDGRKRITTDWINLFYEPELCFDTGDCLVYLREPGQSSRGPSFRIHTSQFEKRGFKSLLDKCTPRPVLHPSTLCPVAPCPGCDTNTALWELYLPAPAQVSLDATFNHHITTRNFFAWLYELPLAGRALGRSLVALKYRLDFYRPTQKLKNTNDLVTYADGLNYLDFRECVDHALAALQLGETLEIEDLWVDAFAHCVGLTHRGLCASLEYTALSYTSKMMISGARLEMDVRLDRVGRSVSNFFEIDLSGTALGLTGLAQDHLDRFRAFLHAFYIEKNGFWPPSEFDDEAVQRSIYAGMYSDFRNLYYHLVDPKSSPIVAECEEACAGLCTLQHIQAFDARHRFEGLPRPLPMIPLMKQLPQTLEQRLQRRNSWNPLNKRKMDKEHKKSQCMQALVDSTNRDPAIMSCLLVRRYAEFEVLNAIDENDGMTLAEGRKVRWIAVYAILQTLISVMQAPKQVRHTQGLTYSLCCRSPKIMPWRTQTARMGSIGEKHAQIAPDNGYSHANIPLAELEKIATNPHDSSIKGRRKTLPAIIVGGLSIRPPLLTRHNSANNVIGRRSSATGLGQVSRSFPAIKRPSFHEIHVPGYGNGAEETCASRPDSPTLPRATSKASNSKDDLTSLGSQSPSMKSANTFVSARPHPVRQLSKESSTGTTGSAASVSEPISPTSDHEIYSRKSSSDSDYSVWSKKSDLDTNDSSTLTSPVSIPPEILQMCSEDYRPKNSPFVEDKQFTDRQINSKQTKTQIQTQKQCEDAHTIRFNTETLFASVKA